MSGSYATHLSQAFPWVVDLDREDAWMLVDFLMNQHIGSSFAITAEPGSNLRRLYLSQVSYNRLKRAYPELGGTWTLD